MQEIRETYRENGVLKELLERTTGYSSPELVKSFKERRDAALARGESTGSKIEVREIRNIGRNDPCPCGSGSKFKKCCGRNLTSEDARVK